MNTLRQRKTILGISIIFLLLLALPLTLYVTKQQQDLRQRAAGLPSNSKDIIAQIDGQAITKSELQEDVAEVFKSAPSDPRALQPLIDELIEKKLLEKVASERRISVNTNDLRKQMNKQGIITMDSDSPLQDEVKTEVLKEKVTRQVAKTRDAFTVGFWIPPEHYDGPLTEAQKTLVQRQRADASQALSIIEQKIRQGEDPLAVAREVSNQFPSLQSIMAVNGYLIATTKNDELFRQPFLYEFDRKRANVEYFKKLFEANSQQVMVVLDPATNAGGNVVKIVGVTNGSYDNYAEWLADQKVKRVKR